MHRAALVVPALLAGALLAGLAEAQPVPPGAVVLVTIEGPITRATDLHLEDALRVAREDGASALVVTLDTPGGGLQETLEMTKRMTRSPVPVVAYVHPRGAQAWSAGTILLMGSHVAAMTPFTVIGSAQPVSLSEGGFTPINDSKIVNALVAQLRSLAKEHGRNATAAEEFVTKNLNLNAEQALAAGVIEHVAPDLPALLQAIDGVQVATAEGNVTLATAGKPVVEIAPTLRVVVLDVFFNPLIAGLLLLVGIYALIFGLGAPGMGAEIAGAIAILLALVGLGFNVSLVGLGLIALGAALILVELHSPGFGVFGTAGLVALVLGTVFLAPLDPRGPGQWSFPAVYQQQVLLLLAIPSLLFAGFLLFALLKVQQARGRQPAIGLLEGEVAEVLEPLGPGKPGFVTWRGERWQAVSEWELAPGERVVIRGKEGPVLRVEPAQPRGPGAPAAGPAPPP